MPADIIFTSMQVQMMMMMFIGTETLVTQLVYERSRTDDGAHQWAAGVVRSYIT
jgi:hypothetical protein